MANFADKQLRWAEALSRPRLDVVATGSGERIVALVMSLAAFTVLLPITNTVPSIALTLMCIGLIQRDGVFALAGLVVGLAWLGILAILVVALYSGIGLGLDMAAEHAPGLEGWLRR